MKLTTAQIERYRVDGYTLVPDVLTSAEIAVVLARAKAIAHGDFPAAAKSSIMKDIWYAKGRAPMPADPELSLWKIMNADRFDPALERVMHTPALLDAVESLIGPDLLAFLYMVIYKPPGVPDSIHPFHQDGVYFPFGPQDDVLGVWIALDRAHAENGTLTVVPGSHHDDIRGHEVLPGVNAGAFAASGIEGSSEVMAKAVTLEVLPGHAVLFHPRLFHRTGGNTTDGHRRVVTFHFASARCRSNVPIQPDVFAFNLVRGTTHPGCLEPLADRSIGFR